MDTVNYLNIERILVMIRFARARLCVCVCVCVCVLVTHGRRNYFNV